MKKTLVSLIVAASLYLGCNPETKLQEVPPQSDPVCEQVTCPESECNLDNFNSVEQQRDDCLERESNFECPDVILTCPEIPACPSIPEPVECPNVTVNCPEIPPAEECPDLTCPDPISSCDEGYECKPIEIECEPEIIEICSDPTCVPAEECITECPAVEECLEPEPIDPDPTVNPTYGRGVNVSVRDWIEAVVDTERDVTGVPNMKWRGRIIRSESMDPELSDIVDEVSQIFNEHYLVIRMRTEELSEFGLDVGETVRFASPSNPGTLEVPGIAAKLISSDGITVRVQVTIDDIIYLSDVKTGEIKNLGNGAAIRASEVRGDRASLSYFDPNLATTLQTRDLVEGERMTGSFEYLEESSTVHVDYAVDVLRLLPRNTEEEFERASAKVILELFRNNTGSGFGDGWGFGWGYKDSDVTTLDNLWGRTWPLLYTALGNLPSGGTVNITAGRQPIDKDSIYPRDTVDGVLYSSMLTNHTLDQPALLIGDPCEEPIKTYLQITRSALPPDPPCTQLREFVPVGLYEVKRFENGIVVAAIFANSQAELGDAGERFNEELDNYRYSWRNYWPEDFY